MNDLYEWIADRHEWDADFMQAKAGELAWVAWRLVMPVSGPILVFLLAIGGQPTGDMLDGLRAQIPSWLPLGAYIAFWLGALMALYASALKRAAKRAEVFS